MLKFGTCMVPNQHQSTLDPPFLLFPTLKVELVNPVVSSRVSYIVSKSSSSKKHLLDSAPPLHYVELLLDQWVDVLEVLKVWLLWHAKVVPP
jgi:hypothetical protein